LGKARGRRLYCNTPTTDNTVQNLYLNAYISVTFLEPVRLPIEDVLDLHTFSPRDVPELLEDYFDECLKAGILSVRLIHGKGSGLLKKKVHTLLKSNPLVASFKDAPPDAGGWGATLVELQIKPARRS
jgi:DNA-nicking Smr family endonuclease